STSDGSRAACVAAPRPGDARHAVHRAEERHDPMTNTTAPDTVAMNTGAPAAGAAATTLTETVMDLAADRDAWLPRVRLDPSGRWYERLHRDGDREIWLISWLPGQGTGLHDHGGSRGAVAVALGVLEERGLGAVRDVGPGGARAFGIGGRACRERR